MHFSMTLFVCHFIPIFEVSKRIVCLYFCPGSFCYLPAYFLFWPFTFIQKFDCDIIFTSRINLVTSTTSMLIKLLQIIWDYVTGLEKLVFLVHRSPAPKSKFRSMFCTSHLLVTLGGTHVCLIMYLAVYQIK